MPSHFLLQAVLLPIAASPFAYFLGRRYGSRSAWFSFAILLYSSFALLLSSQYGNPVIENYPWFPQALNGTTIISSVGNFGLYLDGISLPFAATIYIICTAVALYSVPYMKHRIFEQEGVAVGSESTVLVGESGQAETTVGAMENTRTNARFGLYFALYLLYSTGMVGTVLSTNLLELYFFFEFMLVPSYFLIAEFGYGSRGRISFMYLLWTHIGALLMLLAFLAMGSSSGNFVFLGSGGIRAAQIAAVLIPWIVFGIIVGLFVKLAAFGLHIWLPYAHAEAPTPISALLSPAMIGIGGYIIIRMLTILLPGAYTEIGLGLAVWGVVTMFYGGIMALAQDDIKRLFAYSSVSQMGYIIFGFATTTARGVEGSVFQFVSHGTGKAILFMVAGVIIVQAGGLRSIKRMGGLSMRLPVTATCAMIGFLTLMGFPETSGFQSEWLIFGGGLQQGSVPSPLMNYWLILSILAVISTLVTAGYTLWTMKRVFFGQLPDGLATVNEASGYMLGPLIFMTAATILLGVLPGLVDNPMVQTVTNLPAHLP